MERTINREGKDYLSNLAKVIVNSKWKICLRKLKKLSNVQEPSDRQDFSGLAPRHSLSTHCLHATLSFSYNFSRGSCGFSRKTGIKLLADAVDATQDKMGVTLVSIS